MATSKEETKVSPILKKRTSPDELVSNEKPSPGVNPLKKRVLPGDEPAPTTKPKKGMPLQKKAANLLDQETPTETEGKEKSSLEQMKERIAAQKKLEQDMMTQQSLRNQERGVLRNKLNALAKEISEEEVEEREKPTFSSDLKTEVLETQNKKLKSDLEKVKKQIQTLQSLEYNNVRVIEFDSLGLSDEFLESIKNNTNSEDNEKTQEQLKIKQEEITSLEAENKKLVSDYKAQMKELETTLNNQIKDLNKELKSKIKELEKSYTINESLNVDKQNLQTENKNLSDQVNSLLEKLSDSDQENKNKELLNSEIKSLKENISKLESLQVELVEKNNKINELEKQVQEITKTNDDNVSKISQLEKEVKDANNTNEENNKKILELEKQLTSKSEMESNNQEIQKEKEELVEKLKVHEAKFNDLKVQYDNEKDETSKVIAELKEKVANDKTEELQKQLDSLNKEKQELEANKNNLSLEVNQLKQSINDKDTSYEELLNKYNQLLESKETRISVEEIVQVQNEITDMKSKVKENESVVLELTEMYNRFLETEKVLVKKSRDVRLYNSLVKDYNSTSELLKAAEEEVNKVDLKNDKKLYNKKQAIVKGFKNKVAYFEKKIKGSLRKKRVKEYVQVINKLKEFNQQFEMYEERNKELNSQIQVKENELLKYKG